MQTLYIDVYFLINTTLDILALYFASLAAKIPTNAIRTVIAGVIGGIYAVICVFLHGAKALTFIFSVLTLVMMCEATARGVSLFRKIKLAVFFLIFEILLGGAVHYAYALLDRYIYDSIAGLEEAAASRNLLLLAAIVLLIMGLLRVITSAFDSTLSLRSATVEIVLCGETYSVEAMIDTGNLATDPMDRAPVMLMKESCARRILPGELFFEDTDMIPDKFKSKIRLIPISYSGFSGILRGLRADEVRLAGRRGSAFRITIAIDKEGGSYGGYAALMPAAAIENVI